jgi:hypothetical protein
LKVSTVMMDIQVVGTPARVFLLQYRSTELRQPIVE